MLRRRPFLAASTALLAAPARGQTSRAATLRFVPHANLTSLDPVWTTAWITRFHAYAVYDTLYSIGADLAPKPQMAAGHTVEDDGLRWTITLRPGLTFHDGEPVRARDAVASLARWAKRDSFGQTLWQSVAEVQALDDLRLEIRLHRAFPLLLDAIAKLAPAFVMPERIAATDAFTAITDATGSGPFRFRRDEWLPGSRAVYEKFEGYQPRPEPPDMLTGGKQVHVQRFEWHIMPDPGTAAAALQSGEVDWWENPPNDLLPPLKRNRNVVVQELDNFGYVTVLRPNHLHPPFDNPAFRRALWPALSQTDVMTAVVGTDSALWTDRMGFFTPGTPLASDAGMQRITAPRDLEAAKRLIAESGYRGERIVQLMATDNPSQVAAGNVIYDMLKKLGLNAELVATDWGTVVQRRASREPVEKGGWSLFISNITGADTLSPATNHVMRSSGLEGTWFGWPRSERLEALRSAWFAAPDLAAQQRICRETQEQAFEDAPYYPLGQYRQPAAFRRELQGFIRAPVPLAWGVRRA
ncbi:ABC transporter substrate-binding protein [Paracraurococcus lichenis]|uniref:ABC transporter substrate-binding protein n=1 Tax=Paracraurococcus lichenis TaxID=3064888 RepID=A0ABT9DXW5_9PROT|nr:ABC transporter substrate-binding protein [Paracraurococcus sp. LOR1-02]MDO9708723.1 ABC transporter substrate-binding protein [Paracraurococcus sp. LOR1-02]